MKAIIRKNLIEQLSDFEKNQADEKARQTSEILEKLRQTPAYMKAEKIALYMATGIEFNLSALFLEKNKKVLIPKTFPHRQMIFVEYDPTDLKKTSFGLLEPNSDKAEVPDLIIVPGLAWNKDNYRIGFGGGYYDRYLENFKGNTISLVYDFQRLEFEPEAHDIRIDEVLSV